ncbi:MAG: 2-C-methyl-D-erythritol 2,4-cyclodiphosphate synthase [Firmicutes bacterium]|nr:2-C-methyl-D-erythritol 2,4-cyclodiphosphate synthase [Bacillota bacterium]
MRIGQGFDAHRFRSGRPLVLGGCVIPFERGLEGDSDADVLTHAIIDAVLGAVGLGDMGTWFRPDDPTVRGARSIDLLRRAVKMLADRGYRVVQVDATVVGEEPMIRPLVPDMRNELAGALNVLPQDVSLKGKSTDGLGWLGRGEGLAALAVAQVVEAR